MTLPIKYYTAKWCPQCRLQASVLDSIAADGYLVEKYDADDNKDMFEQDQIQSVPTTMIPISEDGTQHVFMFGIKSKETLMDKITDISKIDSTTDTKNEE